MNESVLKTLLVSFSICLICSLVVSFAAVGLRDIQIENKLNDQRLKILQAGKIYNPELEIKTHDFLYLFFNYYILSPKNTAFINNLLVPYQKALKFVLSVKTNTLPRPIL